MELRTLTAPMGVGVNGVLVDHPGGPTIVLNDHLPIGQAQAVADRLMAQHHERHILRGLPEQEAGLIEL